MRTKIISTLLICCGLAMQVQAAPLDDLQAKFGTLALAAQGRVGVAATLLETGETAALRGDEKFPMQSVYKLPIAMVVLQQVDRGVLKIDQLVHVGADELPAKGNYGPLRDRFPSGGDIPLRELLRFMVSESDNTACDVLLRLVGGPEFVTKSLRESGLNDVIVATTEKEMAADEMVQYRNSATPLAMVAVLRAVHESRGLSASSRALLVQWMTETKTGPRRIKGLLPAGTVVAHKTGTAGTIAGLTRATNDAGLITLPDGRHLAVVVFVSDSPADEATRENVIAAIANAAWEFWKAPVKQ